MKFCAQVVSVSCQFTQACPFQLVYKVDFDKSCDYGYANPIENIPFL